MGFTLNQLVQERQIRKIQKFFNDLKTVAFTGSFSDLTNKPENANTFQGTIAEWNQLTTAEKKAYDHASIPDSIDGGVTFPASKVMMLDGDSVEDRITANGIGNYVNISTYNSNTNYYTCPDDGYIKVEADAALGNRTVAYIVGMSTALLMARVANANVSVTNTVFVRKGTKVYITRSETTYSGGYFFPLV